MSNMRKENELELSRFWEYLLKSRIVTEKYAPGQLGSMSKDVIFRSRDDTLLYTLCSF